MKKAFSWVLILVFLALLMLGVILGKNWEKILKIFENKTTADVSKVATQSSLISNLPTINPTPVWKTYVGETIYTTDGSSQFEIKYPPDWTPTKNVLYYIGQNPDGTTANLTLGAGGHGIDPSFDIDVSRKTYPAGEFAVSSSEKGGFIIASMQKNNISYIFELKNVALENLQEYKNMLDKMLETLKLSSTKKSTNNFSSQDLGISFSYSTKNPKIIAEIQGNKIFVSEDGQPVTSGQWVEVFSKDKNKTMANAIKTKLLNGIPDVDCFVVDTTVNYLKNNYPSTYKIAEISFPKDESGGEPWWSKSNKCPSGFSQSNGISYFLEDTNHPDKYVFLSIGQYPIPAEDHTKNWQDTIEFL